MMRLILFFMLATESLASPSITSTPPNGNVTLSWDYDTNALSTNLWFNFYETTNLTTPLSQWNVLTNVVGTNLSVQIVIAPGQHFIVATASNFWGESSITSNMTVTPPVPVPINNTVRITKSP